jgi:hypothetical protein
MSFPIALESENIHAVIHIALLPVSPLDSCRPTLGQVGQENWVWNLKEQALPTIAGSKAGTCLVLTNEATFSRELYVAILFTL